MTENNVAAQAGDEPMRAAFEAWHRSKFATRHSTGQPTRDMHNGIYAEEYGPEHQQKMWHAFCAGAQVSPRATADVERDKVLEEAAAVCDDKHHTWRWDNEEDSNSGPRDCAAGIRALKSVATTKPGA